MRFQRTTLIAFSTLLLSGVLSGCNRDQDQTTPVGQKPQGQSTAQEYPSTRNMEQPDPSVGGNNSATSKPAPQNPNGQPPAASPSSQ